jgi:hypothetical protein
MSKFAVCVVFAFLSSCSTMQAEPAPLKFQATEVANVAGSEPRQFVIQIEDDGQQWPKMVTLEGQLATAYVGKIGDHGRSVEVTCQGEWASVAVLDHHGPGNQQLVCRFESPILSAR